MVHVANILVLEVLVISCGTGVGEVYGYCALGPLVLITLPSTIGHSQPVASIELVDHVATAFVPQL